jgi:hypothetical protein
MHVQSFEDFLNEAVSLGKPKSDFSGLKWGARLEGERVYKFKSGGHGYILDFTIDTYVTQKDYILRWDLRTEKEEFKLVKNEEPFELSGAITNACVEVISDLQKGGYGVIGLKIFYSIEPGEEKERRRTLEPSSLTGLLQRLLLLLVLSTMWKKVMKAALTKTSTNINSNKKWNTSKHLIAF